MSEIQQAAGIGELFDTLLVFENYPVDREGLAAPAGGLRLGAVEGRDATHYPLALLVQPGEVLRLRLDHRPDLISRGEAELIGARLIRLLAAAAADAARPLGALPILDDAERDTLLRLWNDTATPVPPATLPELFAQQAARTPDATAVMFEGRTLSYAALDAHANRLAHHLRGLGVGPETVVGLCLERSPEMLIGLLGILKAGGAYLPLDPNYPRERLAFMLADAGAAGAGDASGAARHVPATHRRRWCGSTPMLLRSRGSRPAAPTLGLDPERAGQHAAYVIYTSGSTGQPKGVVVTHAALGNFLGAMAEQVPLTADDRLLAVTTIGFDIAALELYLPLLAGAAVVIAPRATVQDAQALAKAIVDSRATVMQATPTLWQTLLADGGVGEGDLKSLTILTGGEPLPGELARALAGRGRGLTNLYGPTETTIWSAAAEVGDEERRARRSAVRSGTRRCMCWTARLSRCRRVWWASSTSPAPGWRGAISTAPG